MEPHAILYGDSIFDNGPYVEDSQTVVAVVRRSRTATLRAMDGATMDSLIYQDVPPPDASHLFLSIGGNDGLVFLRDMVVGKWSLFQLPGACLDFLNNFEKKYEAVLDEFLSYGLSLYVCTIYYPYFDRNITQIFGVSGVVLLNRIIRRVAEKKGVKVIDLYDIVNPTGLVKQFEPGPLASSQIGAEIVKRL